VRVIGFFLGWSVETFIVLLVVEAFFLGLGYAIFWLRSGLVGGGGISGCLPLLKDAAVLSIASLSVMAYMKIDQVMLGVMQGKEIVGIYSVAVTLSEGWNFSGRLSFRF